jgi:hypothetical protein
MTSFLLVLLFVIVLVVDVAMKFAYLKWFSWISLVFILGLLLVFIVGPLRDSRYLMWLILASTTWGHIVAILILRHRAGQVLQSFRQSRGNAFLFSGIVFAAFTGLQVMLAVGYYERGNLRDVSLGFESLCEGMALLAVAINMYIVYQAQYLITENGITLLNGEVIQWKQIVTYGWDGVSGNQLALKLQAHRLKTLSIPLLPEDKESVDRILKQYVQQPVDTQPFLDSAVSTS